MESSISASALPIGIYSAVREYSFGDYFFTCFSFVGLGVPDFFFGDGLRDAADPYGI